MKFVASYGKTDAMATFAMDTAVQPWWGLDL